MFAIEKAENWDTLSIMLSIGKGYFERVDGGAGNRIINRQDIWRDALLMPVYVFPTTVGQQTR